MKLIKLSKGFAKKRLGEYTLPIVYNCAMERCLYCYVPSQYARVQKGIGAGDLVYSYNNLETFSDQLLAEIDGVTNKGEGKTIVISPSTEPFAADVLFYTMIAVQALLVHSNFTVRIITKKPLALKMFLNERPMLKHCYKDRLIINISMGIFSSATLVEPGADITEVRMACLREFLKDGMRCALMMCPVLPMQEIDPFLQYGPKLIGQAEEVFSEPLNPRGNCYDAAGKYFPAVLRMKDRIFRSQRNLELIRIAHDYVPAEKLRVLIYGSNLGQSDQLIILSDYPGTILL